MRMRASAIVRTKEIGSIFSVAASGVPGMAISMLIGTLSGCCGRLASVDQHVDPVFRLLAHADDAAGAHLDAGVAHACKRLEAIGERARRDDLAVVALRGIDVVVVVVEAGVLEPDGIVVREHAERHAGLETERLDALDHGAERIHVARPSASARRRPCSSAWRRRHARACASSTTWLTAISLLAVRPEAWWADWLQ